jgi:hypothetical protein
MSVASFVAECFALFRFFSLFVWLQAISKLLLRCPPEAYKALAYIPILALGPKTCFLTCLVMSFTEQLASDFVFTPYVSRQRHGIKVLCDAGDIQNGQHVLFHCANPHVISFCRKYASLFLPT